MKSGTTDSAPIPLCFFPVPVPSEPPDGRRSRSVPVPLRGGLRAGILFCENSGMCDFESHRLERRCVANIILRSGGSDPEVRFGPGCMSCFFDTGRGCRPCARTCRANGSGRVAVLMDWILSGRERRLQLGPRRRTLFSLPPGFETAHPQADGALVGGQAGYNYQWGSLGSRCRG
jgi:hypothetical protein